MGSNFYFSKSRWNLVTLIRGKKRQRGKLRLYVVHVYTHTRSRATRGDSSLNWAI